MKRAEVIVIGRNYHPDGKETATMIQAALAPHLEARGMTSYTVLFKDLIFDISSKNIHIIHAPTGRDLNTFDGALMTNWFSHASIRKDMALTIALYLKQNHVALLNSEALHSRSSSKLSQMIIAAQNGITIPRTIFSLSLDHLVRYLTEQNISGPFVFKDAQASRGNDNHLLTSAQDVLQYKPDHSEKKPFIIQTVIDSGGADYRFFVAGGQTRLIIKRVGKDSSHLNNTSTGATTELVASNMFSAQVLKDVKTISRLLHREVTGIDFIFDKDMKQSYFLEANPIPQIATGSNVESKLVALADALQEIVAKDNNT